MRFESLEVTQHAVERWAERVRPSSVREIKEAIRRARILGKNDPLPGVVTKRKGRTYCEYNGAYFVLKNMNKLFCYTVLTVLTHDEGGTVLHPRKKARV